jgi:hypothetical protein
MVDVRRRDVVGGREHDRAGLLAPALADRGHVEDGLVPPGRVVLSVSSRRSSGKTIQARMLTSTLNVIAMACPLSYPANWLFHNPCTFRLSWHGIAYKP